MEGGGAMAACSTSAPPADGQGDGAASPHASCRREGCEQPAKCNTHDEPGDEQGEGSNTRALIFEVGRCRCCVRCVLGAAGAES